MPKFQAEFEEKVSKVVIVDAENAKDAYDKAFQMYLDRKVNLCSIANDCESEISVNIRDKENEAEFYYEFDITKTFSKKVMIRARFYEEALDKLDDIIKKEFETMDCSNKADYTTDYELVYSDEPDLV